ncbi:MAG: hypothetical protein JO221_07840 [Sphingomonas sp.]|nr:hypothetical protein [Sphingomonas sp.]
MPTEPPPSRYRVVERGRRLEVIDTRVTGAAPAGQPMREARRPRREGGIDGSFTTARFYDDKAPRRIAFDTTARDRLGRLRLIAMIAAMAWVMLAVWQPWVALAPLAILVSNGPRRTMRQRLTRWLDRYEQG